MFFINVIEAYIVCHIVLNVTQRIICLELGLAEFIEIILTLAVVSQFLKCV